MGAPSMYETHPSSAYSHNPPPPPLPLSGISDNWGDYFPETKSSQYCDGCGSTHGAAHEFDESNSRYLIGTVMDQVVDDMIDSARPYLSTDLLHKMRHGGNSAVDDAIKVLSQYSEAAVRAHVTDATFRGSVKSSMPPSRSQEPSNQSTWTPPDCRSDSSDWAGRNRSRGSKAAPSNDPPNWSNFYPKGRI